MRKIAGLTFGNKWVLILSAILLIWVNLNYARWNKFDTIQHDVNGYYSYLPAFFYENDLSLNFTKKDSLSTAEGRYYWPNVTPEGGLVIKYTMGMAVTYLPFFTVAHLYCQAFHLPTTGFSTPYHVAIQFSSVFYVLLGLFFLMKMLEQTFSKRTTWLTSALLLFGTNLYYYCVGGAGMAHATVFGFAAMFLFFLVKWHHSPSIRNSLFCGLSLGLLILIRPTLIIYALVPLLFKISSVQSFKIQWLFFKTHFRLVLLIIGICFLLFLPQLLYWKLVSGHYFFNSYIGEKFYFKNPHFLLGLFSFRKGWLLYTPLMGLALLGFIPLYKHYKHLFAAVFVVSLLFIYIVFSWWCWWYGGSFGQRALIDLYPLLAFPLAALIEYCGKQKGKYHFILSGFLLFFLILNLFQSYQAMRNVIHYDSMTSKAYWHGFFKLEEYSGRDSLLVKPDYSKALNGLSD